MTLREHINDPDRVQATIIDLGLFIDDLYVELASHRNL